MPLPLWTPYTKDEALDLSKPVLKTEPASPPPAHGSPYPQHSPDYASVRKASSSAASPQEKRSIISPQPYLHASPAYVTNHDTYPTPKQNGYTQNHLVYPYASFERVRQANQEPQYHRYPTPTPQISPASSSSSSRNDDAACMRSGTLSPPESPPTDKLSEDVEFLAFERNALRAMALKNGGSLLGNNPRMRRTVHSTSQNASDDSYKTQRQRNNLAAKQSRDRRKLREIHLALKVSYLSNTISKLKAELASGYCRNCQPPCGSSK